MKRLRSRCFAGGAGGRRLDQPRGAAWTKGKERLEQQEIRAHEDRVGTQLLTYEEARRRRLITEWD